MADPGDLFATASDLLAAAAEALDTIPDLLGTHLDGAPERQLISAGQPVADCCEQLAVWVNPINEGNRSPLTKAPVMQIVAPTFRVLATRCVPTGKIVQRSYVPPEAEDLTAAAEQHMADGWALWNHLLNLINADLLFDRCGDLTRWSEMPIAGGGCAGWELQFTVGLDGYPEELTT